MRDFFDLLTLEIKVYFFCTFGCLHRAYTCVIMLSSFDWLVPDFAVLSCIPVVTYSNANVDKLAILAENRYKSGIYRWTNLTNDKTYIGSAVNLYRRFVEYYSDNHMKAKLERGKSAIFKSLLKYGHLNFKLDILVYCKKERNIKAGAKIYRRVKTWVQYL